MYNIIERDEIVDFFVYIISYCITMTNGAGDFNARRYLSYAFQHVVGGKKRVVIVGIWFFFG